ncbi:hypothetical protein M413DRAFT_439880 [Hebeloma cylindrosporum]|uniref:N-acetyltransferase domain-containing protein n=1 Tax=Hebeloma cylindrosporum TaxID=76867 RepID=A0A0C3CWF7_HEBCY|nr:hypothetical protein M413DRAFT_439880 [Hebeloma cylindrosporum h7]
MASPVAAIRNYEPSDKKLVHFMVGKSNLQALAVANNKIYTHPITIALWIAMSSVFISYMSWWPASRYGWLAYLRPLPALASMAVPIMFFVDWINRPYFEELTQKALRHGDLSNVLEYYSRQPASGFWILEYGDTFVGLIAMDATQLSGKEKKSAQNKAPKTALIRHFYVEEQFRRSNVQEDLLKHAVKHAFEKDAKLERIEAPDSPLIGYLRPCLRSMGFELDHHTKKVGFLRWNLGTRYLERESWNKEKDSN